MPRKTIHAKTQHLDLLPWEEVARRYNEANGTNLTVDAVRDSHFRAMCKIRRAIMSPRYQDLLSHAQELNLRVV
jgi:hypothetical protein